MFCSTVIATIGRPTLDRAVNSVISQEIEHDDFEVIVVNDSGRPLAHKDWHDSQRVQVIETNRRMQSVARNSGAAISTGAYLHFLDDDDWLLPGALASLKQLAMNVPYADWIYGGTQLVDRGSNNLFQLHQGLSGNAFAQVLAGEWLPLTSSIVRSDAFFAAGGFNPLLPTAEDFDLCRRILLRGDVAGTETAVACHSIGKGSSTLPRSRDDEFSQWARETVLEESGVLARMLDSANGPFWHGRICRAYLTSAVWNMAHKNRLVSINRLLIGILRLALSVQYYGSTKFWVALTRRYQSSTFEAGKTDAGFED